VKVVEVYKDVHPFVRGGIEKYVHDLSVHLARSGHRVEILVAGTSFSGRGAELGDGITITGYPSMGRVLSTPVSWGLSRILREIDADVFHFHMPLPSAEMSWLLSRRRTPVVATYHSDIVRQSFLMPLYGPFLRVFLRRARLVLPTSPAYAETSRWLRGLGNLRVVPIGADPIRFSPSDEASGDYCLFVGRFRRYKGIEVLLEAWRSLPDMPMVMAGGGPLKELVMKRAADGRLNIRIVEDPSDDDLVRLYRGARCLVLPSTQRSEAFGMVQVEAMACGIPVISTDLPTGVPWVNQHMVSGLIIPPGDPAALVAAVRMMDTPGLRETLSEGAVSRAGILFNGPILLAEMESILKEAVERSAEGLER
jgi:glycosyltransferase involved in cell wall biosynthesis